MGAVLVQTNGQRLTLNSVTGMGGAPALLVYSDAAMTVPVTLPSTFVGDTTFYVENGDSVWDVAAPDGTPHYDPARVQVQQDRVQTINRKLELQEVLSEARDALPYDLLLLGVPGGAGGAGVWGQVTGTLANQTDLKAALDGKQPLNARLTQIGDVVFSEDDFIQVDNGVLANKTPAQVLAALAPQVADVGGLTAALAAKVSTSTVGQANGIAGLDASGKVPSANIPSIVPFTSQTQVADSAARLAQVGLTVPQLTIQNDNHNGYVLLALPASTSGNWAQWTAGSVTSVNGLTGTVSLVASDVSAVPTTRTVTAGTGLTGGGALSADRTVAADFGTSSGKVCQGNDTRLTDARTPTAHASTHASVGSDPVTVAQSQVTGLTTALGLLAPKLTPIITVSGTSHSATSADNGSVIVCTSSSATTITVPAALPLGWSVLVLKQGTGNITVAAGSGATLRVPNGARITTQYEQASVACVVTNEILVDGGVVV